ncbi:MAG: RHS repeat-associated core domain-containing protein [Pyrinomonadaceae bacterium]|nr:RHS repeat-associated core domain-containing protein [Pyrinomonadaceae bacterium]
MAFGAEISETLGNVGNRATAQGYNKPDEIRKQYTGYEHDDESGLDFAQARYYNATHGRFTSIDPLTASANVKDPQTFNRYTYAMNSPYKFTYPLGLISSSTNACGQWCRNTATSSEMDTERVGRGFSDEGHQAADQPNSPPAAGNGVTTADSITPTVEVSSTIEGTQNGVEGTTTLPEKIRDRLQKEAEKREQNGLAQAQNANAAVGAVRTEFNHMFAQTNPITAAIGLTPDPAILAPDGTIIPPGVPDIGVGVSLGPVSGAPATSESGYSKATLDLVEAANSQLKEIRRMENSQTAENFAASIVKDFGKNGVVTVSFTPKGSEKSITATMTKSDFVVLYNNTMQQSKDAVIKRHEMPK